jgi:predicted alpha/beta superfamily hydrolase
MLENFLIPITPFNHERMIQVYLPQSYHQSDKRYPVLYMHDGQNVFQDEEAIGGVSLGLKDFLDESELEIIVVAIDQNPEERINEYCPWLHGTYSEKILEYACELGGKGGEYVDFIVNELKPLIDTKYRTLEDRTAMAGISLGGLLSTYAACRYPQIFTRIAAISSGFYRNQEAIEECVRESDLSSVERFYLDFGTKEGKGDEEVSKEVIAFNQAVAVLVSSKIPNAKIRMVDGGEHNYTSFKKRVPDIFTYLFSDYVV